MTLLAKLQAWLRDEAKCQAYFNQGLAVGKQIACAREYDQGFCDGAKLMLRKIAENPDTYVVADKSGRVN